MLDLVMRALSHILMPLFLLGMAGASIVVVITIYHDVVEFFDESEDAATPVASGKPSQP